MSLDSPSLDDKGADDNVSFCVSTGSLAYGWPKGAEDDVSLCMLSGIESYR